MLTDLGHLSVWLALVFCAYAAIVSIIGASRNDDRLVQSARYAALLTLPLVLIGCLGLWYALFTHDFGVKYVTEVSSLATPMIFRFTALWGAQAGSILFWCLIMSLFVATVMLRNWKNEKALLPYVTLASVLVLGFFIGLELLLANAFIRLDFPPADGRGLNPLLRHPGMIIHPPMLYAGYTGMLPSFAFCIASLATRRTDNLWLTASRRWTLFGWVLLTAGLILGGRWAHDVLGWGGYWGWDPSENMPFITWLLCTAFLHSQMIQEKRGMFKNWNVFLMLVTFASMFFGTAFIRSGLLTSVHAFAASNIGPWFMGAMALMLIGSTALWLTRLDTLKSENNLDAAFSREGIFLLQNVLFVSTAFTVFIGTIFPILSEGIGGKKITVGPPFFDQVAGPQMMILVFLMGVAPLLAWARASARAVGRMVIVPLLVAVAVVGLFLVSGRTQPLPLFGIFLCAYTLAQTLLEYVRGVQARMNSMNENIGVALWRLLQRNQRRYGGYFVHIGVVLIAVGALGKGFYGFDHIRNVQLNETFTVGDYTFTYRGIAPATCEFEDCQTTQAALLVQTTDGRTLGGVYPHRDYYPIQQHTATIADISGSFNEEVYVLLGGWDKGGATASFHVYINPFINWIWAGGIIMVLGFMLTFWRFETTPVTSTVHKSDVVGAAA
ncbi:MAG: heme lyase CcmF/NrfE family subunit [Chloroflexi bacterium]|nr:heme lyase CcmF/NrfE family subunit [Chloroflexota bacterium]